MDKQEMVHITIFQAPFASLIERGLYMKMYDLNHTFQEQVPAEYYLAAFKGTIECPAHLPEDREQRTYRLLEHVFTVFNTKLPAGYCGRSLSVGDVVKLENKHYLCAGCGFKEITFVASKDHPAANPTACPLVLPNGAALQVTVCGSKETTCPCINIDLVAADGIKDQVCFVEYNPDREPGHELCIGVYCADREDTVYYDSFVQGGEKTE